MLLRPSFFHSTVRMSQYTSTYPSTTFKPSYTQFFETFYKTSDTPSAHEAYASSFTPTASVIMASKKVQGYDGKTFSL